MKTLTTRQIAFRNRLSNLANKVEALPKEKWNFGDCFLCAFPVMAHIIKERVKSKKLLSSSNLNQKYFGITNAEYEQLVMPIEYDKRTGALSKSCTTKQWVALCRKLIKKKYG